MISVVFMTIMAWYGITVENMPRLLLTSNMKLHIGFQLVLGLPVLMTLNNRNVPLAHYFHSVAPSGAYCLNMNKDKPILSATKIQPQVCKSQTSMHAGLVNEKYAV